MVVVSIFSERFGIAIFCPREMPSPLEFKSEKSIFSRYAPTSTGISASVISTRYFCIGLLFGSLLEGGL